MDKKLKLCLVASSGGHLMQLLSLKAAWGQHERFWISFPKDDALALLKEERVIWAHHPTNRNLKNLIKNIGLAWHILRTEKPDAVISTGAGVAVPFLLIGKMLGIKTVYIESLTRIEGLSLSGKMVYPFVSRFFVQWADLAKRYPKAIYEGQVL